MAPLLFLYSQASQNWYLTHIFACLALPHQPSQTVLNEVKMTKWHSPTVIFSPSHIWVLLATNINYFSILEVPFLPLASATLLTLTHMKLELGRAAHKRDTERQSLPGPQMLIIFNGAAYSILLAIYIYSLSNIYTRGFNWQIC